MKLRIILGIVLVAGICIYVYQYHEDKYHSAVSYVVQGAETIKQKVGILTSESEESSTGWNSATQSTTEKSSVLEEIVDHMMGETSKTNLTSSQNLSHTDQKRWKLRRGKMCHEVDDIPRSEYGRGIYSIGLSYFTKYDPNYKFLYCSIPKVASSNWKRTMIVLSLDKKVRENMTRDDVHKLKNVHNDPRVKALSTIGGTPLYLPYSKYYKFVLFRHPFTRMVSAWRNKLQLVDGKVNKYFYKNYGIPIIKLTRGRKAEGEFLRNQANNLVTFEEFVIGIKHGIVDRHWMPQVEICRPCFVDYSFVGFFEHINEDTQFILEQVGVEDEIVQADKVSPAGRTKSTTDLTRELFNNLSQTDVDAMYKFYKKDFVLFGYDKDVNSSTFPYPEISRVT